MWHLMILDDSHHEIIVFTVFIVGGKTGKNKQANHPARSMRYQFCGIPAWQWRDR